MVKLPSIPKLNVDDPVAKELTGTVFFLANAIGVGLIVAMNQGYLGKDLVWIPLGVLMFSFLLTPLATLGGISEALSVLALGAHQLMFILTFYREESSNALLVFILLIVIVIVVEFPRRFSVGDGKK